MIRVALFLLVVSAAAFGLAWIADRPGEVSIAWLGWRIETSIMVAVSALAALVVFVILLYALIRALLDAPDKIRNHWRERRRRRGASAISRGLLAVASGDRQAARALAGEARRYAPQEPLVLLLEAQAAQLGGDRAAAERTFQIMAERPDTRLLGLRGLHVEALRRNEAENAAHYAEEAARTAPALPWAGQALLQYRCAEADWEGALATLERNRSAGLLGKPEYRRQRAVLLTATALAKMRDDMRAAREMALEAAQLAPDLVPAAVLAARLAAEAGDLRRPPKIIEAAWKAHPHPDLARAYAHLRAGDSARERLVRTRALLALNPGGIEGALAVGRAALDAREFGEARMALAPFLDAPTQRTAMLMAEIEEAEHGDEGRAREWMSRAVRAARDAAWTADGFVAEEWMPVSPVTGRIDAFEWKQPGADLARYGAVIEDNRRAHDHLSLAAPVAAGANGSAAVRSEAEGEHTAIADQRSAGQRSDPIFEVNPELSVPDDPGPAPERGAEAPARPDVLRPRAF